MTLFYCVFDNAVSTANGPVLQEGTVATGGTSVQSAAIIGTNRRARTVRMFTDTDCFVTWGEDPAATDDGLSGRPMGTENPEYFEVESGQKLAVIQRT